LKLKTIPKEWGTEYWYAQEPEYGAKVLIIQKDKSTSLHYHEVKKETLFVWAGNITLELDDQKIHMAEGTIVTIKPGQKHRIMAHLNHTVILEVSTPQLDERVRIE